MSIINGYLNPKFIIRSNGHNIASIELPLTNSGGLVESYDIIKQQVSTIEFRRKSMIYGFHITWQMNYDEYITGESALKIKQILEHAKAGNTLILVPRKDHPWRNFEVYVSMDNFELGLRKGGPAAKAHKSVVLQFSTVNIEPDLKWYNSSNIWPLRM